MNHEITQVDAAALLAAELMLSLVRRLFADGEHAGMTALLADKAHATIGLIVAEAVEASAKLRTTPAEAGAFWSRVMAVLAEDVRNASAGTQRVPS
jgi:hypothetical protein